MNAVRFLSVCSLFALLALVGCGSGSAPKDGSAAPAGKEDTLAKIKREGVIKWGADSSGGAPFVYLDPKDNKTVIGFEMDIMDKFAKHLGVKHEQIQAQWDALIDDMRSKRSDLVMNGIEINPDREKAVGLSDPYYLYEQQLTVRADDKDKYKSLADLKGKKVATLKGAEANNVLKAAGFNDDTIAPQDDSSLPYVELENKRVDAVLQESIIAAHYAGKNAKLHNVEATFSPGKYVVAVRKEDATLLAEVNRILKLMKENGELAEVYKKWGIWNDKQKDVGIQDKK